jgi:hypothetical protein
MRFAKLLLAAGLLVPVSASALWFFTVDIDTDMLMRINAQSGQVREVGPLDYDVAKTVDLTLAGNRLFGLDSNLDTEEVKLLEIDPATGQVMWTAAVTLPGGTPVKSAEGLAHVGYGLVPGIAHGSNPSWSNTLAEFVDEPGFSGEIAGLEYLDERFDMDGLGGGGGETLYSVDVLPPGAFFTGRVDFYEIDATDGARTLMKSFEWAEMGHVNDLAPFEKVLYAIENDGTIHVLNRDTYALSYTVAPDAGGNYRGLAPAFEPGERMLVDHFACYNVAGAKALRDSVDEVIDQFRNHQEVTLRRPSYLCTPADKEGEGMIDPYTHLLCFDVKERECAVYKYNTNGCARVDVRVTNQLGTFELRVKRSRLFCVPSYKEVIQD